MDSRLGLGIHVNVTQHLKVRNCRKCIFHRSRDPKKVKTSPFGANHCTTKGSS